MPPNPPFPGCLVDGRYLLSEHVGSGGMGQVFRAVETTTGRDVALKILHPDLAENHELTLRFAQEGLAASRIRHPNVVEVHGTGGGEYGPYLAMEYLEGESLGGALRRLGRVEPASAIAVLLPVLAALGAIHAAGVIHRDLKPENVFLVGDSAGGTVVRVLDFGIAKVLDSPTWGPRTRTGVVYGTPDYMSPEQATADTVLDGRSDLFAVGVLLYELLTGSRPFRAASAIATAFRVVHADPTPLAARGVQVPADLEAVLMRLLRKDPRARWDTASDAAEDLGRCLPDPDARSAALAVMAARPPSRPRAPAPPPPPRIEDTTATTRTFPVDLRGRFTSAGALLAAIDTALAAERHRIMAALPPGHAFAEGTIRPTVAVAIERVDAYLAAALELGVCSHDGMRDIARRALDEGLVPFVRATTDLVDAAQQGAIACARLLDFGTFETQERGPREVLLLGHGLEATSSILRSLLCGVVVEVARRALSCEVSATQTNQQSYVPELAMIVAIVD